MSARAGPAEGLPEQLPERLPGRLPEWMEPLARAAAGVRPEQLSRFLPPPPEESTRQSAVLMLFGEGPDGPDVLFIERAHDMRSHPGQPAFPGGAVDPGDAGPVAAALREAVEETGLEPSGVEVVATLPALYLPPSGFVVVPVVAWWRKPSTVRAVDAAEVAGVVRVPLAELIDPDNRLSVHHPSGYVGPAFRVRGLLVWGFTAGLVSRLLAFAGLERPWDAGRVEELPTPALAPVRADGSDVRP
ncbi:CoA pyrophosphatase [soil metagenome]